jgi:hypothetical protein
MTMTDETHADRRARAAMTEREIQRVEQSDLSPAEALADIGVDVDAIPDDGEGLSLALQNIRKVGNVEAGQ